MMLADVVSLKSSHPLCAKTYGAKAAGLNHMYRCGLRIPDGVVLGVKTYDVFHRNPQACTEQVMALLHTITEGKKLGQDFLVSVRSGAPLSMPGMMDTVLNVGMIKGFALEGLYPEQQREMTEELAQWVNIDLSPQEQLQAALSCVWESWHTERARCYREKNHMDHTMNTAVIVQRMVFGNIQGAEFSGTGVAFSHHPKTGEKGLYGEFLPAAQGNLLVGGHATPLCLSVLRQTHPALYYALVTGMNTMENACNDMQEMEFTVEKGQVWFLQTRNAKRSGFAGARIAYDKLQEKQWTLSQALHSITVSSLGCFLYPQRLLNNTLPCVGDGLSFSPGVVSGPLFWNAPKDAAPCILLREETSPEDMPAVMQSQGVLTLRGGMASHAAVVMRGMGKPCVGALRDSYMEESDLVVNNVRIPEGTIVTLDGTEGRLFLGNTPTEHVAISSELKMLLEAGDAVHTTRVMANADTLDDWRIAKNFGACGVGLCRTEHMMLVPSRLENMHAFIMSDDKKPFLTRLASQQTEDFYNLLRHMEGLPLTLRLLDPPLHEFLPHTEWSQHKTRTLLQMEKADFEKKIRLLKETNPMMGHRGCRVGFTDRALYAMQIQSLYNAILACKAEGIACNPSLLIPFVAHSRELEMIVEYINAIIPPQHRFPVGVMIELPRAALLADKLAPHVDFMSFGTNDLTQTTWGLSRDDSAKFWPTYHAQGVKDPFAHFDHEGVGALIIEACKKARSVKPEILFSVCGEHASLPEAIAFFQRQQIHTLSCSPHRILQTRLLLAQQALSTTIV